MSHSTLEYKHGILLRCTYPEHLIAYYSHDGDMAQNPEVVSAGARKLQEKGGSVVISIPKKDCREQLGIDLDELKGEHTTIKIYEDGSVRTALPMD